MSNNFGKIFAKTKNLHDKLDKHPFLIRYANDTFTLQDRHRHLQELLPIYEAIEKKMIELGFQSELVDELAETLTQAEKIKEDIAFMEKKSNIQFKKLSQTEKTKEYIKKINQMTDPHEILAHFYVRILGDFHGGPLTKMHVISLLENRNIRSQTDIVEDVKFYTFGKNASEKFHTWLNNRELPEKSFQYANDAFQVHLDIFDEMEQTRSNSSFFKTCSTLFNPKNAAAVVTASIVATTAFALSYTK